MRISAEESAALVLLKSTGLGVLGAAQLAATVTARIRTMAAQEDVTPELGVALAKCLEIIELGIAAAKTRERTVSFEEAGRASVTARADCRPTTRRDLRYYLRRMLRVDGISQLPLRTITTRQCRELLQSAFGHSKSSYIKGRAMLHSIFAYGMRQEWCDGNPVARIEVPKVHETPKTPLPVEDIKRLQQVTQKPEFADMKLSLNLLLHSGIRPAEVCRLRAEEDRKSVV